MSLKCWGENHEKKMKDKSSEEIRRKPQKDNSGSSKAPFWGPGTYTRYYHTSYPQ